MKDLHNTPAQYFMPSIAGPKFDIRRQNSSAPRAIIIQYDSSREFSLSYEEMESFYTEVGCIL
jgi:protein dispatched 1